MITIKGAGLRSHFSLILLIFALFLTVTSVFYAEVFRTVPLQNEEQIFPLPFKNLSLADIEQFTIQNKNGKFEFIHQDPQLWKSASGSTQALSFIEQLLDPLMEPKIRNLHIKNAANLLNYSLENPYATIVIQTKLQKYKVELGLLNSVDKSQYLNFSHMEHIYQVDELKVDFDNFNLKSDDQDLIFRLSIDEIKGWKILSEKQTPILEVISKDGVFSSPTQAKLSDIDLRSKLLNILQLKSLKTLKNNILEKDIINNYLKFPLYYLELEGLAGKKTFIISSPLIEIKSLGIPKDAYFLIASPENQWSLVESKSLSLFQLN